MFAKALTLLDEAGAFAASEFLAGQSPVTDVLAVYNQLLPELYWERKSLPDVVLLGSAGYELSCAAIARLGDTDPAATAHLQASAKVLLYNVASFTWDGWDEPDVVIGPTERKAGLDAARAHLALAKQLETAKFPLRRAWWMLGAHHLSAGDFAGATKAFDQSAQLAERDGQRAEQLLALGFGQLTLLTQDPQSPGAAELLETLRNELTLLHNGPDFVAQLDTAGTYYGRNRA